ncbi:putative tubby-like protein [Helianthus anomalus]
MRMKGSVTSTMFTNQFCKLSMCEQPSKDLHIPRRIYPSRSISHPSKVIHRRSSIDCHLSSSSKDINNPSMTYILRHKTCYKHILTVCPSQTKRMVDLVKLTRLTKTSFYIVTEYRQSTDTSAPTLMDALGRTLHTVRRKSLAYVSTIGSSNNRNKRNVIYEIQGSYAQKSCMVYDDKHRCVAKIRRKEAKGGVALGGDVFALVVQPSIDPAIAMVLVIILDQMFDSSRRFFK